MKKKIFAALAVSLMGVLGLVNTGAVSAYTCPDGVNTYTHNVAECSIPATPDGTPDSLTDSINGIINVIIGLVGLVAIIVMIIGGIYFLISQGDSAKITRARNTVLYGVVGLVIALLSFAIVNFVIQRISGSSTSTSQPSSSQSSGSGSGGSDADSGN